MKKRFKYKYFVSYQFKSEEGTGFGSMILIRVNKLNTSEEIESARNFITETNKFEGVVIMNIYRLKNVRRGEE